VNRLSQNYRLKGINIWNPQRANILQKKYANRSS